MANPTLAEKLNAHLDAGQIVTVSTAYRSTAVTPKSRAAWRAYGHEIFKIDAKGDTVMIESAKGTTPRYAAIGGKYEPIVKITASERAKK